ncbi:O-methyltransferase [Salinimicrobium oceani]|uniref:Class I SAM-dependent methyltransferase n=1 Tax=Salinimicrobium oceani TaxID=2722702 RepID=A0ABX1CZI9_9FLAO|nr:class I SAM-dependent methyltransferase [Salinimicrobium oceani]NJW53676.1 class I SAM-dependent methyltransferase [Salinimicrobium oceani]
MHILLAYIKFLLRSTNQHGVHSPFIYNMVTRCFYDRKQYASYDTLKNYRRSLLKDNREIEVKDFGVGSRVFKSDAREVSKMAKTAGISPKRARLLNRLVRYLKVDQALELGTHLGQGTAAMAAGNEVKITTVEGCPETAAVAGEKFQEFAFKNIRLKVGKFEDFLEEGGKWKVESTNSKSQIPNSNFTQTDNRSASAKAPEGKQLTTDNSQPTTGNGQPATGNLSILNTKYSLLYIDGNHQKEATLSYFEKLLPTVHNDSVMIFDDIHWSAGMEEAWEEIKAHPEVRVTIDTFQWGLVFFRREQEKEHFVMRV